MKKNSKVIYTCITGGYDTLIEPSNKIDGYDYICFTDDKTLTSRKWEIRQINDEELLELDNVRKQRGIKIRPHRYLSDYDMSVWVDGNTNLNFNLESYINSIVDSEHHMFFKTHAHRKCIYKEGEVCISRKKDKEDVINEQIDRYKKEGYPTNQGLAETNFIIRFHNEEDCKSLMEDWFNEVKNGSRRDQLSFNYCVWKNKSNIKYFNGNRFIQPKPHNKGKARKGHYLCG